MDIGRKLSDIITSITSYFYTRSKRQRIRSKTEALQETIDTYKKTRELIEKEQKEVLRLLYQVNEELKNTKVPELNEKLINYLIKQLEEAYNYALELHKENRRLWVENKRLLNELTLRKEPFPEIVSEVKSPLVVTEDINRLANTFPYSEEEKRIILTLLTRPVDIKTITFNAATTKSKVKKFLLQIYKNQNRIANRFGEVFKLVYYKEGRSKETKYMLLPVEVPTAKGAEKLPVEELVK